MKTHRKGLKTIFVNSDRYNKKVHAPYEIELGQWKRLVDYWMSKVTKKKSDQMKAAKATVTNQSQCGCGAYGKLAEQMVRVLRNIFLWELGAIV